MNNLPKINQKEMQKQKNYLNINRKTQIYKMQEILKTEVNWTLMITISIS
jgi:hypothetical protein